MPAAAYRLLGNPVLLAGIYVVFVTSIFLHGLVIWDDSLERISALLVGGVVLVMTALVARGGAFSPRATVELRDDQSEGRALFSVTAAGRPAASNVALGYADGEECVHAATDDIPSFAALRQVTFEPSWEETAAVPTELKVWAHRVAPDRESEALPALACVRFGDDVKEFDLGLSQGRASTALSKSAWRVEIILRPSGGSAS